MQRGSELRLCGEGRGKGAGEGESRGRGGVGGSCNNTSWSPAPTKALLAGFMLGMSLPFSPPPHGTGCPRIISRRQWGARPPRNRVPLRTPVPYVIIHHTAGNRCTSQASCSQQVRGIQNYHMDTRRWPDIGYNFLIGEDGRVYEGRGWSSVGAHAYGWNYKSLGFSFLGNFSSRAPNAAALNAAKSLIQCAVSKGFLRRSYTLTGHRNVNPTSCCPRIISRSQWRARTPRSRDRLRTPVPYVIIHHTAGNRCYTQASCSEQVRGIQNYHINKRGWSDIGYNFLIGEDGRVYEGRGWSTMGAHAKNWNSKSLGFSFLGTFTIPNAAALNAARSLIQCAISKGFLSRSYTLKGHRNVSPTSCPGNDLYRVISRWARFKP
uniref:Peptidoglycan recognition protein 1 n=1 Tax=Chrysemys picta bellii TaxID=8478 RepID=A0A8C3F3N5_CHRPI